MSNSQPFVFGQTQSNVAPMVPGKQRESAVAYLNLSLPRVDGTKAKVDGIGLRVSVQSHKALLDFFGPNKDDWEAKAAELKEKLIIEFNPADGSASAAIAL